MPLRPCTICMYSGIRKFAAVPTNSMMAMQAVIASSELDASTRRSKMRGSLASWRLRIQAKKTWPPIRPSRMSSGAGEMPMMLNGACSVANQTPQLERPLKPKLRRMMETAAMMAPVQSIFSAGCAGIVLSLKLSSRLIAPRTTMRPNE